MAVLDVTSVFAPDAPRPTGGLWLAHKPVGATSFEVVKAFHAQLAKTPGKALKASHGGALDPFAEGLLPVLVGSATKLFPWLHDAPKRYRARVRWGTETDSGDGTGQVVSTGDATAATEERLTTALAAFRGWTAQVPPSTSNKWVDGERAYARAHRGEEVVLPPTQVYLHQAELLAHGDGLSVIEVTVRGGFYVRALVRDLGRRIGVPAHVEALQRLAIGPWLDVVEPARSVEANQVLPWLPARVLSDAEWGLLRARTAIPRGQCTTDWPLPAGFPPPRPEVRALHLGRLVGLLRPDDGGRMTLALHLS